MNRKIVVYSDSIGELYAVPLKMIKSVLSDEEVKEFENEDCYLHSKTAYLCEKSFQFFKSKVENCELQLTHRPRKDIVQQRRYEKFTFEEYFWSSFL